MVNRVTVYPGAIPLETDLLNTNRNFMVGLGGLAKALFGSSTIVNGLSCIPTSPASMQVSVGAGEIYSQANIDDTPYSSLLADVNHQIMKQGILLDPVLLSCPAPSSSGNSINYLIEARYIEADLNPVTLPYYNASNPSSAYSGPANSGQAQSTTRAGTISLFAKPGISAATGSQATPAADAGYVGLWVVTVAYGATSIVNGNIAVLAGAPFIPAGGIVGSITATAFASRAEGAAGTATGRAVSPDVMAQSVQAGSFLYATGAGDGSAITAALTPAPAALVTGLQVVIKVPANNASAATLNLNALGAKSILVAGAALKQGMLLAGQIYAFVYDGAAFQLQSPSQSGLIAWNYATPSAWWEIYANGKISQGGQLSIGSGSNTVSTTLNFPIPWPNGLFNINGNADGPANSTWYPIVATFLGTTTTSCLCVGDTASPTQTISAGRKIMWRADGN